MRCAKPSIAGVFRNIVSSLKLAEKKSTHKNEERAERRSRERKREMNIKNKTNCCCSDGARRLVPSTGTILYLSCFLLPTLFSCSLLVFFRTDLEFVDLRLDDFGGWTLS